MNFGWWLRTFNPPLLIGSIFFRATAAEPALAISCLDRINQVAQEHAIDLAPPEHERLTVLPSVPAPLPSRGPPPQPREHRALGEITTVAPQVSDDLDVDPTDPRPGAPLEDLRAARPILRDLPGDARTRTYLLLRRARDAEMRGNSARCFELVTEAQKLMH